MADVYDYIVDTGVIIPDAGDILTEVQNEYKTAFGADLNVAPNTPQGILIAAETQSRIAVADNNATLANQINPNQAGGVFLDALIALTNPEGRIKSTPSLALCTLTGVVGTSIPAGAQISDSSGNLYQLVNTTVIPTGGTIDNVSFTSVLEGPIPGNVNTLTTIVSIILGWETVTNPAAVTLGTLTQSDVAARVFRQDTLFAQGANLAGAIIAALTNIDVGSLIFRENTSNTTQVIDGVSMISHSLYICVDPGSASLQNIAQTITNKKSGGCGYNNGLGLPQSEIITNPFSGQMIDVLFDTPSLVTVSIIATVHAFTSVQNIQTAVQNAILTYASGGIPNERGFVVGASVSPFQLAGAINILVPGLFVQEIQVAVRSLSQIGTIINGMNTMTGMTYNSALSPGMGVAGPGIPPGITISSLSGSTGLVLSGNATANQTGVFTFSFPSLSFQTTEIPIAIWQKAFTSVPFITVDQV